MRRNYFKLKVIPGVGRQEGLFRLVNREGIGLSVRPLEQSGARKSGHRFSVRRRDRESLAEAPHESRHHRRRPRRALLRDPREEGLAAMRITVYERNRADDTFGFGVVFSDETLETFEKYDLESYRAITANFAYWDDIEIHFKGTVHRIGGNGFCGCARVTLLKLLHERARQLGVELKFQTEIDPAAAARCRSRRRGRRHQFAHPRAACGCVPARDRPAPEQVRLDGIDAPVRCLHVLLPRDRARHLHRALLPVRAGSIDLGDGDRSGNLRARRARQARRSSSRRNSSKACSPRSLPATS